MFKPDFLFGAATAAYQIEGAVAEDGRGPSIWDTFSRTPGKVYRGDTGDIACDHYHRLETDLDLLTELGLNSYRFSIAWPRVLPSGEGPVNQKGLDFYKRLLERVHRRNLVPMVTLYHWDLPQPLQDRGGWASRETASRFADYVSAVAGELGDLVPLWVTVNEPWCAAFVGHLQGRHAPGLTDLATALRAAHHLMIGHAFACEALRAARGDGQVGISLNLADIEAGSTGEDDTRAASRIDGYENRWFLDPLLRGQYPADLLSWYGDRADVSFLLDGDLDHIAQPLDFLGVNYYEHQRIAADPDEPIHQARELPPVGPTTHGGVAIEPAGLTRILCRIRDEYGQIPIHVTECGANYHDYVDPEGGIDDVERVAYLQAHLQAAAEAVSQGVELRGFYVWSLLDNFEWALGYGARFGLVYVDFRTQTRLLKRSAYWYRTYIGSQAGSGDGQSRADADGGQLAVPASTSARAAESASQEVSRPTFPTGEGPVDGA
jgi:beta-glucosidase